MNRYWMEDSYGKYGVQLDAFGPYRLPGNSYQYFLTDQSGAQNNRRALPAADAGQAVHPELPHRRARARGCAANTSAPGQITVAEAATYDNVFYVSAGEDESSTWQEFGEMKWKTKDEVTDPFGPKAVRRPDPDQLGRVTRYVPWTALGHRGQHLAERVRQHVGRGRELGHGRPTPTSSRTTSACRTTTTTRSRSPTSGPAPACGT